MTTPAGNDQVRVKHSSGVHIKQGWPLTNIGNQIRSNDPAAAPKLLQVIGNRHQCGTDYGDFEVDEKQAEIEAI